MARDELAALLSECQDTVDHVTLEDFTAFAPSELLLLEQPAPWKPGQRYRCFLRTSLADYAASAAHALGAEDEGGETGRVLATTYLPGVELDHRDLECLVRHLERPALAEGGPAVVHVARVIEVPASRVYGSHGASAHIHELAEAQWERELWQLLDQALLPTTTACPAGHPLQEQLQSSSFDGPRAVICDGCERRLTGMRRYRCMRFCDFDLCRDCYASSSSADVDRPAWLRRELARFWEEHPDLVLPPAPPRLAVGVPRLSSAITKWNGFALEISSVLQLREIFLASLEEHGLDVCLLRPDFWPGFAEQRARAVRYVRRASRAGTDTLSCLASGEANSLGFHARSIAPLLDAAFSEAQVTELLSATASSLLRGGAGSEVQVSTGGMWKAIARAVERRAEVLLHEASEMLALATHRLPWLPWWHLAALSAGMLTYAFAIRF